MFWMGFSIMNLNCRSKNIYTDTSGFTDHVFALMQLLGFKFAPRIRDLNDKKLFIPEASTGYSALSEHIGETINSKKIIQNWDEILRLAASIKMEPLQLL